TTYVSWNLPHQEANPLGHVTEYAYTRYLHISKLTDPGGNTYEFDYDLKDRLTEVRYAGRLVERYEYDKAGNIIAKLDASGASLDCWEIGAGNVDKVRRLDSAEE